MKHTVGVADMKIAIAVDDVLVTHALGSCLGLAVYDPRAKVGGLLHVMLPDSTINASKAQDNPSMFVDTGVPHFFRKLYQHGAAKEHLIVKVAGGAAVSSTSADRFNIGKRNYTMLKKLFWKNGILIAAEDVGGSSPRTMYLQIGSGRVWVSTGGCETDL